MKITNMLIAVPVGVACLITGAVVARGADVPPPPRTHWMSTPCLNEEFDTGCAWNAQAQGNGEGHSFYVVKRPVDNPAGHRIGTGVCVFYVKHADALKWDACHLVKQPREVRHAYLRDTHGNDDLGSVTCHFVRPASHSWCLATDLFGSKS